RRARLHSRQSDAASRICQLLRRRPPTSTSKLRQWPNLAEHVVEDMVPGAAGQTPERKTPERTSTKDRDSGRFLSSQTSWRPTYIIGLVRTYDPSDSEAFSVLWHLRKIRAPLPIAIRRKSRPMG